MGKTKSAPLTALAPELRELVRQAMGLLGECFEEQYGAEIHSYLLQVRSQMSKLRGASEERKYKSLRKLLAAFRTLSPQQRQILAHGYTLMMEITNVCENGSIHTDVPVQPVCP